MQSLVVEIQNQKVAFDIHHVHAVSKIPGPLTILPHTSEEILGAINFRGKVVPVYNLNANLNLLPNWDYSYLVVIQKEGELVGILSKKMPVILEREKRGLFSLDRIFKKG